MSDRKYPPGPKPLRRMQSQDERDMAGFAARRERESIAKEFASDEITGHYEGEELASRRAARPPDARFERLEKKHDDLKADVDGRHKELKGDIKEIRGEVSHLSAQVHGAVGTLNGQERVLTEMLGLVRKTAEREIDRQHVTFTAKVDVDRAKELANVDVDKGQKLAQVDVEKETQLETLDAKKKKRELLIKATGLLGSGAAIMEVLHRLGVL